jgi:hypothetical protein
VEYDTCDAGDVECDACDIECDACEVGRDACDVYCDACDVDCEACDVFSELIIISYDVTVNVIDDIFGHVLVPFLFDTSHKLS